MPSLSKLTAAVLGVVTVLSLSAPVAFAHDKPFDTTINVQGTGQVVGKPDSFNISVSVENSGKTMALTREENARRMSQVIAKIKGLNIPDLKLQTSYVSVYPLQKSQKLTPYAFQANNSLTAKIEGVTDTDALSRFASLIMDSALGAGASSVNGPNFYLGQNNIYHKDALKLAVTQARQTADVIAAAAGVKIAGVYSIETYSSGPALRAMPMAAKASMEMAADSIATPIEVGDYDVSATVTIKYLFQN